MRRGRFAGRETGRSGSAPTPPARRARSTAATGAPPAPTGGANGRRDRARRAPRHWRALPEPKPLDRSNSVSSSNASRRGRHRRPPRTGDRVDEQANGGRRFAKGLFPSLGSVQAPSIPSATSVKRHAHFGARDEGRANSPFQRTGPADANAGRAEFAGVASFAGVNGRGGRRGDLRSGHSPHNAFRCDQERRSATSAHVA